MYFFGHRDAPPELQIILEKKLIYLIEKCNATMFYIGNHGNFDHMAKMTLKKLKYYYPHIDYTIVLAYTPNKNNIHRYDYYDTIFPNELDNIPPKYAIIERNKWMINKSDYVITYVNHNIGGAARFKNLAEKKGRIVINLSI